jgi:HK97 family phage prohead protease
VDHTELVNKQFEVTIEKATSADYDARFVMSATSPDRVKDTIDESAYKPNLGKKIIALWQHNSDQPFGYWHNLRVESGKLIGDLKAAGTNLGLMIKQLLADGVPLGASIGFRGKGEENKQGGIHFKQIELLECSVVSVPAHPLAYQIAKSFGIEIDAKPDDQDGKPATDLAAVKQRAAAALHTSLKTLQKDN